MDRNRGSRSAARVGGRGGRGACSSSAASASSEAAPPVRVAAPVAFADGFRVEAMTTYALDPGKAVHVALDITVTNQRPNQVEANGVRTFYLPTFSVPVLAEAVGLRATKAAGPPCRCRSSPLRAPGSPTRSWTSNPTSTTRSPRRSASPTTSRRRPLDPSRRPALNEAYATFVMMSIGDPGLTSVEAVGAGRPRGGAGGRRHAGVGAGREAGVHRHGDRAPGEWA